MSSLSTRPRQEGSKRKGKTSGKSQASRSWHSGGGPTTYPAVVHPEIFLVTCHLPTATPPCAALRRRRPFLSTANLPRPADHSRFRIFISPVVNGRRDEASRLRRGILCRYRYRAHGTNDATPKLANMSSPSPVSNLGPRDPPFPSPSHCKELSDIPPSDIRLTVFVIRSTQYYS